MSILVREYSRPGSEKTILDIGMEKLSVLTTADPQTLQNKVIELERQLAEAKATLLALTSTSGDVTIRRFELLFSHGRDIIFFIRRDDGHILDANAAAIRGYGYSYAELLALTIHDLRAPDTQGQTADQMARADVEGILFETAHRRKDGSTFPVEISSQGATLAGGRILVSVIRDITGRKQVEEDRDRLMAEVQRKKNEAQQRAEELNAIIEALQDPVMVYNRDGLIYRANASAVRAYGFDPGQQYRHETNRTLVVRHPDGSIIHSDDMPSARALRGETVTGEPLEITNEQGRDLTVLVTATPLIVNGVQMGAVSVWHDITEQKQAERALRGSEEKYRKFFDQLRETVSVFEAVRDEQGDITDWVYLDVNQAGLHYLGIPRDQVVGQPVSQVLGAEVFTRYMAVYCEVLDTGKPFYHDTAYRDQHFLVSVSRMGENRVASIGLDITERKQAEKALRESEEMLRLALTAGQAGAWSWDLSANALQWSDEYYRIFGFEPASIQPSAGAGFSRIHPDDLSRIEAVVHEAIERGTRIDEVHRVIWPDGSVHWVRGISRAFYNEQGEPYRMAGIAMDITDQKQAEIQLQAAHHQTVEILESISDAFYSLDQEGRFTYVNQKAARLWKKEPGDLLGKIIWEVFPSGKETESYRKIQQALAERQPIQYESYSAFLDQLVDIHLYPTEQGISVYFQDISTRKRAEEALAEFAKKLERSNRELEQFAFVASHDLQEPLRKIEAFGDSLLENATQLDDRGRNYVERMRKAAGRMRDMVDGLLQLSRVNTQGQPFVAVDLSRIAEDVLSDLDNQVRRTGGRVEITGLPVVEGDPLQLHQLLQNLIGNALKYHRPDTPPCVKVCSNPLSTGVQILVEDNGIGFDPEKVEQMFQPFQRLVGRSEFEGSGIGLAICRKIVERHGGEITAICEPGKGATFIVTLPARFEKAGGN